MRKLRNRINRTIKEVTILFAVVGAFSFLYVASFVPTYIYFAIGILAFIVLLIWATIKSNRNIKSYINEKGYIVLVLENDLEHRFIAKKLLNRDLKPTEIVHHINGKRSDNQIQNLCLMDNEKHELFHSWLSWKKRKTGIYPSFPDQKRVLTEEYNGILLEHLTSIKSVEEQKSINTGDTIRAASADDSKMLFEDLRKERLRIARELKLPAYMIFYDRTLHRMARTMPDTDAMMLKTVGPSKYQKYGPTFLSVIKKFKNTNLTESKK